MNKIAKLIFAVFMLLQAFECAQAQIGREFEAKIAEILSRPHRVYQVSEEANEATLKTVDAFFFEKMALNRAQEEKLKVGPGTTRTRQLKENIVIFSDTVITDGARPGKPITVWYESSPRERSFHKDMDEPSDATLKEEEVTRLAQTFITRNRFYRVTAMDSLGPVQVVSRIWSSSEDDFREADKKTIFQRVIFKRRFDGLDVIGSKQIVDVNPKTREVLSYKSLGWSPVDESAGKEFRYLDKDEVVAHIDSVLGISTNRNNILSIEPAYLQTETMLVPVIAVESSQSSMSPEDRPSEKRTLLVYLPKDLPRPSQSGKVRLPGNP